MNDSDQFENSDNTMSSLGWGSSTTEDIIYLTTRDTIVDDEIGRFSRPLLTFAAITTIIIMMVGIFGNLLTILALVRCPKVRNVAAAFIISLCLADCLFCAIVLPFSAFRFIQGTWTHGDILCQLIPFIQYGNIGVSLLCIAIITINRYIMITHHNGYARIYKRHWIGAMIAFCWLFAYGMQLPTLLGVWGTFGFDSKLGTCSIMTDKNGNSSKTALFIIAFVIPCIIIIGCYTKIFWVVHRSEVRLRQHANNQNSIPNNLRQIPLSAESNENSNRLSLPVSSSSCSTASGAEGMKYGTSSKTIRVKDQRDIKAKRNEWRITKMVLAIFLSFVVCYLPITVVKVADKDVYLPGWHIFGYIMLYLSACINPIIYVIMNKQYRQAYKTVLMCQPSRLLPFTNPGSSAGEKWKDTGCSYKHSHTIVSQVSVADRQTSSNSYSSNQTPIVLELSPQTVISLPNLMATLPNDHPSTDRTTVNIKKKTGPITPSLNIATDYIPPNLLTRDTVRTFKSDNHHLMNANSNSAIDHPVRSNHLEPQQIYTKPLDGTLFQGPPIILSVGDIMVEEEKEDHMEEENWDQTSSTTFQTNPFKMPADIGNVAKELKNLRIVEKDPLYKQDYKQNTNVIPDSNSKITSKSNILVN